MTAATDSMQDQLDLPGMHLPSLLVGLAIMVGGTVFPLMMSTSVGKADHGLAALLF
jgi:hypothetical protein